WRELDQKQISPVSGGRASTSTCQLSWCIIEHKWLIFKLCHNGWNLHHLTCVNYPGWKRTHLDDD
ncbi:hypothetical protein PAXRUDRAFT_42236, partial [Paxillus rubicundulus Ve08.2h10]